MNKQNKFRLFLSHYTWVIPFLCFVIGYQCSHIFFKQKQIRVPSLVGKSLQITLEELSKVHLAARLLEEKEDANLQEGTILYQIPNADALLKANQTVSLVVSKKPSLAKVPLLIEKSSEKIKDILTQRNIRFSLFFLPSSLPQNICFAQFPLAGTDLEQTAINLYISQPANSLVIVPDCKGIKLSEVTDFLDQQELPYTVFQNQDIHKNNNSWLGAQKSQLFRQS
jgi:serine/threonine-protein kinase